MKYDINSDAAHKFERNTDPYSHDYVLRRFINIVESHTKIKKVELFTQSHSEKINKLIPIDFLKVNKRYLPSLNRSMSCHRRGGHR